MTFGDGVTTRVLSRETLNVNDFPLFKNMLHVDGLKANLISISSWRITSLCQKFGDFW